MNVLLVGHSFIRRLGRSIGHSSELLSNFGFSFHQCVVRFHGVSGGTLRKLQEDHIFAEKIRPFRPKIIIVQLGGSDLCIPNTRPEVFACELKEWMETLMGHHGHIKHVFICELFVRRTTRGVNVHIYESRRTIVNKMLKALIDTEENMTFWRHLRLMNSPLDVLDKDCVHLIALGTNKFYRSLRLALIHAIRPPKKDGTKEESKLSQ